MKKTAIIYITDNGHRLAQRLETFSSDIEIVKFAPGLVADLWGRYEAFVFIMASGIVVRTIAQLMKNKKTDPAIVVLDEAGKFSVSLLSGHLGGANELANNIARFLGGEAVITTASDVNGLVSIDLWAGDNGLVIEEWGLVPRTGARLVNNGGLTVYSEIDIVLPAEYHKVFDPGSADVLVTNKKRLISDDRGNGQLYVRPKNLILGIGCNKGASTEEIEHAVQHTLEEHNLAFLSIGSLATIDMKADEPGLVAFAKKHQIEMKTYSPLELNGVQGVSKSEAAFKATGAVAVAEPAALLAARADALLVPKQKRGNVTVAVAEKNSERGKIFIVGIGPGSEKHITPAARDAIRKSDIIVGYGTYLELIQNLIHDKEVVSTGMTQEVDRCRKAVDFAAAGRTVAVISSGDPGVYAMAGLVFEILRQGSGGKGQGSREKKDTSLRIPHSAFRIPEVEVVPGISALNACASRLGAPLMHDFASISLSDRLTPWPMIEKRLEAAASADFVIVLYNPRSKGRAGHMSKARELILRYRLPETPVGIVKGAMRDHETVIVTDLGNMRDDDIDMQTTVIIGNSKTFRWNNLMITPRGYEIQEGKKVRG